MRRSLLPVAAVLALAVAVLSACGGGAPSAVPPSSGSSAAPPPLGDPGSLRPEPANTVTPSVDAEQQVATRWTSAEPVAGRAAVLVRGTLTGGPPCQVVGRVEVDETATSVVLTVHVGREPGADCSGPQAQVGFPYVVRVPLTAPVGDRTLRDGAG